MDAPIRELERIEAQCRQGRQHLAAGRLAEALAAAQAAQALEAGNVRALALEADVLHALGRLEEAWQRRRLLRMLKRQAWQRMVEAEIRGQHLLMGEATRHAQF
jgi:Flp pilus assembly protein TadD